MDKEEFWIKNIYVLLNNYYVFFPNKSMTKNELLNSLTRFSVYLLILFIMLNSSIAYMYIPILLLLSTIILYSIDFTEKKKCQPSTKDNPYINPLLHEYNSGNEKLPPCENQDEEITKNVTNNLYMNMTDLFAAKNNERQFFTMPVQDIANAQSDFANWLYGVDKTCKEDNYNCLKYDNLKNNFKAL